MSKGDTGLTPEIPANWERTRVLPVGARATMPGVETGTYGAVEDLARNRVNLN
ncbi:hypothetical protein GZL_00176 [Streptomyces sp. 769]|nr:hypothetical protein GZL_00176 [Streptomyces sp. 769]